MDIDAVDATPGAALLSSYGAGGGGGERGPMRTPMRTPMSGGAEAILMEADNLRKLTSTQSSLLGGSNPELHPSDFAGVLPSRTAAPTPNAVLGATPVRSGSPGSHRGSTPSVGGTPRRGVGGTLGGMVGHTPMVSALDTTCFVFVPPCASSPLCVACCVYTCTHTSHGVL